VNSRKWVLDKLPKIVLGHNGKKFSQKYGLGPKRQIFAGYVLGWY
jgi:hypothetical protein